MNLSATVTSGSPERDSQDWYASPDLMDIDAKLDAAFGPLTPTLQAAQDLALQPPVHPFVARLAARRLRLGLTEAIVAQRAGVSEPTVNRVLRGVCAPTFATIDAIARAMGKRLDLVSDTWSDLDGPPAVELTDDRIAKIADYVSPAVMA